MEIKDLTPELEEVPVDRQVIPDPTPFGQRVGGIKAGGGLIQRGAGNETFKASELGIHLGAANFSQAPFSVDMEGNLVATSVNRVITVNSSSEIQPAMDSLEDGGTVVLLNGTYVLTADLVIPSAVTLEGQSRDGVIIDCNTSYSVQIAGSNPYSTGTVTINMGDSTVVGAGTTFTSAMVGRYILLDGAWYEITGFSDTTHILIGEPFTGSDLSGSVYQIATVNFTASLNKVTIMNASGSGLKVIYTMEPKMDDVIIFDCGIGIDIDFTVFPFMFLTSNDNGINLDMNYTYGFKIDFSEFNDSSTGAGVVMTNCGGATFFDSAVSDNTGNGMSFTNCENIAFLSMDIFRNGSNGVELISGCNELQFTSVTSHENTGDGYKITATSDRTIITSSSITDNGGYGVNIAAASCDENLLHGAIYKNNFLGAVSNSGTGTLIRSNIGQADN